MNTEWLNLFGFSVAASAGFVVGWLASKATPGAPRERIERHVPPLPIPRPPNLSNVKSRLSEALHKETPRLVGRRGRFVCVGDGNAGLGNSKESAYAAWYSKKYLGRMANPLGPALCWLYPNEQ